jgi:adenylate cyclase
LIVALITKDTFLGIKPLREVELKFIDLGFQRRGEINIKDSSQIVIVELNDETYKQLPYKWPWPRTVFAKLVDNLTKAGAKVIAIDVQFFKQDEDKKNDDLFREAVKRSGKVVLAAKLDFEAENKINNALEGNLSTSSGKERSLVIQEKENFNNIFCDNDTLISFVNIPEDIDQTYRFYTPFIFTRQTHAPKSIPTFGLAVVNKYLRLPAGTVASLEDKSFVIDGIKIPMFSKTDFLVNLYGSGTTFIHHNLYEIVDDKDIKTKDEIDYGEELNTWDDPDYQKLFKDKIVLIGSTSVEDKDLLSVAFSKGERSGDNTIFGIEYHANVIQNILSRDFLYTPTLFVELIIYFFISTMVFYLSSLIKKIKIRRKNLLELINVVMVLLLVFGVIQLSIFIFVKFNYIISVVGMAVVILLTYFGNTAYHFVKEKRQNVLIKGMFSHYVSHSVVDQLLADPDKLKLGGEKKNLTILFADIAGFTTISESKTPEDLVKFINTFLSEMTEIILRNQGTLDKYLGDAIMAFWGAPLIVENHAALACKTACEMQEKILTLKGLAGSNFDLRFRMGINTGDVVVGNIGGENRFDYTVIGDSVNLASRLEGVNKEFGTNVIIGEETSQIVNNEFFIRELDVVKVKGKKKPTRVFELIGMKENEKNKLKYSLLDEYFEGLKLYREKEFSKALICFEKSLEKLSSDTPSKVYIDRIKYFISNPPDESWDGVFEMKTK